MRQLILPLVLPLTVAAGCSLDSSSDLDRFRSEVSDNATSPRFSPDGSRIAFRKVVDGRSQIFIVDSNFENAEQFSFGIWDYQAYWSPDGTWIAFDRDSGIGDVGDSFAKPLDGGPEIPIAQTAANERVAGWMPDGSGVLIQRNDQTWVAPLHGDSYRLLDLEENHFGQPSPAGRWIAVGRGSFPANDIGIIDMQSGEYHALTESGFTFLEQDAWSPDGTRFTYTTSITGTLDIWVAETEPRGVRQLTRHLGNDCCATWSPDGRWVAFVSDRGGEADIWVTRSDGSASPVRVTDNEAVEWALSWSPDGTTLLANQVPKDQPLIVVNTNTGRTVTIEGIRTTDEEFTLSPDATHIAFTSERSGNRDIWVVPVEGGEPHRLTQHAMPDFDAHWSPDGSLLVFGSRRTGDPDLFVISRDGTGLRQLADAAGPKYDGKWSPDGSMIVYNSNGSQGGDLWTVPASGGEPRRLTRFNRRVSAYRWSPDGNSIAAVVEPTETQPSALVVVPAGGGEPRTVYEGSIYGATPHWSPDGASLAISIAQDGYNYLHVVTSTGGTPRRVTQSEKEWGFAETWTPDGREIIFRREGFKQGEWILEAVSVRDGTARSLFNDPRFAIGGAGASSDGAMVAVVGQPNMEAAIQVRIAELLEDLDLD